VLKRIEVILVLVCLFVTFGIYAEALRMTRSAATNEFQRITEDGLQALQTRMDIYLQSLNGAAGMMQASEEIEVDDFDTFVRSVDLTQYLPGINGIGFIEPVPAANTEAFVADMRANGAVDFDIHPQTDSAEKYIIKYIAPTEPNKQALGLDVSFEQGRREAANRARETGLPQLTPRILLVQDQTKQPGFLLLRPLYANKIVSNETFRGWIYAPFVGRNLLMDLTPEQNRVYDFSVYDGVTADPETLIYQTEAEEETIGRYDASYQLPLFGRTWTVSYQSTKVFDGLFPGWGPLIILIAGILLTATLAIALRAMRLRSDSLSEVAALRGQQISAREEENRSIVENAVVAVIILDENRRVLFANHAAVECFGYRRDGMGGLHISALVTEADDLSHDAGYNAIGMTQDGDRLYLNLQQNAWVTLNGVRRFTAIVRDVTAEVAAVQEVATTKQRYDMALEGSKIGVFEIDLKTGTSVVSQTWRSIMDVPPEEEDTQGVFMDRIHPDDLPVLFEADKKCINGDTNRSVCEYRMQFDDHWRWMRSDAVVVARDETGAATRMVGTQTDVTQLRHARNALEDSEQRFRTVLEAAPVGMAIITSAGHFTSVNTAMCDLTGYSQAEMTDNFTLMQVLPDADIRKMRAWLSTAIKHRSQEVYRAEHPVEHKDGGLRWGLFNVTWTFDKNARSYVYIAQVNDITDKKQIEQIKSEFVSTVSHELRTPLTSIKGALGLIPAASKDPLPASVSRLIDIARSNANRLVEIVNDILDLEKISSGEVGFDLIKLDLSEIVEASVQDMMPFAVQHKNTIVCDLPDEPVFATVDRLRSMQVLANLISNACKYSSDDSEVRVRVEKLEDMAIVYVQNVGPGVPDAFKTRIFQAFSQADGSDTRAKGGTGLGLNITRQIVLRQGGNIGFESRPDGPTVFWFTCPLADAGSGAETEQDQQTVRPDGQRLRVLHLEDDEDFAEVIRMGLSPFADVQSVTRLTKARAALNRGPLDVIILDWTLPDGDAAHLLEDILAAQPTARIVSLTSDGSRKVDARVSTHLIKSQTELSHIIKCVAGISKKAS
jgi:PAS domain S-box-containing protein